MRRPDRVLADDTTVEDLAARGKQPGKPHGKSSEVQYEAARKKYWLGFCKYANWDPVEKAVFLDADGTVRDGTFRQLFIWLYELDNASKAIFKSVLAWAQAELNKQLGDRLLPLKPAYVCSLPGVNSRKNELYTNARQMNAECMLDMQAVVESDIGFDKMREMVVACLKLEVEGIAPMLQVPSSSSSSAHHHTHHPPPPPPPLPLQLQMVYELRSTHQLAARHDEGGAAR